MPSKAFEALVALIEQEQDVQLPIPERRAALEQASAAMPLPEGVTFEDVDAAGVPCEWVAPTRGSSDKVVLYLHGGAYTVCSPRTHRRLTAALARELGGRVLAADYRLAPEDPFPAAVEDAVAAYRWIIDGGAAPEGVAIAGDSAGGGLAIASLVALRDRGLSLPAAAVAISPWADLEMTGHSMTTKADVDVMIKVTRLKASADAYLAGQDPRAPLASPIYADLKGLPPLFVHVGGREVLLDDATRLVDRARADGVDVTLEIEEEMIHVWHAFATLMPEADEGVRRVAEFLRSKLG
jgi:phosphinothricin tripeptide acetyl hydrolase